MKIIKLSINSPKEGLLRQTPNNDGIWGNYKFLINKEVDECDFWVVYSKGEKKNESCKVAPENIIFISGEPESIYHYSKKFLKQFSVAVTTRDDLKVNTIIKSHPAQQWWVGKKIKQNGDIEFSLKFNDFVNQNPIKKTKLISVITSNKGFTKGHKDRIKFVHQLKKHFGSSLDVFGKGINDFEDKWGVLKDYKYHIVIENSSFDHYFTEKLTDSYLAGCFPFYYGANNLKSYFSENSFRLIDINDVNKSIKIIEKGIFENLFEKNKEIIEESKRKVLYEYNIFPLLAKVINKMDSSLPKKKVFLKHEMSYFDLYKIPMLLRRIFYKYIY